MRFANTSQAIYFFAIGLASWLVPVPPTLVQPAVAQSPNDIHQVLQSVQPKMVKIFGAGGLNRLEAYQTGCFISGDGLILTSWSYVLDSDDVAVMLSDGRRLVAELVGFHPQLEIALLKIDVAEQPFFDLDAAGSANIGTQMLVFSNLYGIATGNEAVSVQRGVVAAKTNLAARRGAMETAYQGPVWILDAITSNPGSAGGAVTDRHGQLIGLVGKELRSSQSNVWLNYAIPVSELGPAIDEMLTGSARSRPATLVTPDEPMSLELLGIVLVPNVLARTPPFIDQIAPDSPAARAGFRPDDLIIEVAGGLTPSRNEVTRRLENVDRDSAVTITVQRGQQFIKQTLRVN